MTLNSKHYKSTTYRVYTPDGTMFVNIMEDESANVKGILVNIGKAGSALSAWAQATATMITLALEYGTSLQAVIDELKDITSDGHARIGAVTSTRSGPEGIYSALIQFRNDKRAEGVVI